MRINEKFAKKYMRLAKQIGQDENPCKSRQIGAVIVDPVTNKIKATGYNGPPAKTPHPDHPDYLREVVWPQLTSEEKAEAWKKASDLKGAEILAYFDHFEHFDRADFVAAFGNSGLCPRRVIGAESGERLEICSCAHAECNAIINASSDLFGCWLFGWCGISCWECSKLIINSGIKKVICIDWGRDYSLMSKWLLEKGGVAYEIRNPETLEIVG